MAPISGARLVRNDPTTSFPRMAAFSGNPPPRQHRPKTTPLVKKGKGHNNKFRERYQRERLRGTFRTRFESKPVTFAMAKSHTQKGNNHNTSSSSHPMLAFPKFSSPMTVSTTTATATAISPRKKFRAHVSPTPVPAPTAPPSATKAGAAEYEPHQTATTVLPTAAAAADAKLASPTQQRQQRYVTEAPPPKLPMEVEEQQQQQVSEAATVQEPAEPLVAAQPQKADSAVGEGTFQTVQGHNNCEENYHRHPDGDRDVASFLCLVPLVSRSKEEDPSDEAHDDVTCYWPSLVIPGLRRAMLLHQRLYPHQKKIQKRLVKEHMKHELACHNHQEGNAQKVVVLPLGTHEGVCPSCICKRPLYDVIDLGSSSNNNNDNNDDNRNNQNQNSKYWKTVTPKKTGRVYEGEQKVIRLLENSDVVASYFKACKQQIQVPVVGQGMKEALVEMERLMHLDKGSGSDSDSDSEDEDEEDEGTAPEFVSSLVVISEDDKEETEEQKKTGAPIRFPMVPTVFETSKRSKWTFSTPTPTQANNSTTTTFPISSQKSNLRPSTFHAPGDITTGNEVSSGEENDEKGIKPAPSKKRGPTTTTAAAAPVEKPLTTQPYKKKAKLLLKVPTSATKTRKKPFAVIDSQDRISVSSWAEVKPLLMQLGHAFYQQETTQGRLVQHFCLPNGDPKDYPDSVEGQGYFTSMESYRAHLCAHGVEYLRNDNDNKGKSLPPLGEDDLELIAYWVRFHVFSQRVTGGRKSEKIPDLELSGNKGRYVKLLQKIGYKYGYGLLKEGYQIPGKTKNKVYLSEAELWEHVAKYGLDSSSKFEKLESKEERAALEIQIIRRYHGNHGDEVFRPVDKMDRPPKNDDKVNNSEYPEYTPAANKDALEACTRGPDPNEEGEGQEAMSPRNLMAEETMEEIEKPQATEEEEEEEEKECKEREGVHKTDSSTAMDSTDSKMGDECAKEQSQNIDTNDVSAESCETSAAPVALEQNVSAVAENAGVAPKQPVSTSTESRDTAAAPVAPKQHVSTETENTEVAPKQPVSIEEVAIEEVVLPGTSNADKIRACKANLGSTEIVAHGQLADSMARIQSFVDTVIESKGKKGPETRTFQHPILYICGSPGTGKTMSTTKLCRDAIAAKTKSKEEWEKAPRLCHISCPSLQNFKYQEGMKKLMHRIGMRESQLKRSSNDENNAAVILILDEVDQLLGSKGTESILKQLSSWAKDENYVLSIIGISNAVFNSKTNRLKMYGMGAEGNKLVFETYRKKDLVRISQTKIGFTVMDKKAHEFIAAKVANSSGDARQYLDLVCKTLIHSRRKMSHTKLLMAHTKPVVTIRDAMLAIRETNRKTKDLIQSLTSFEKMTLCAGVHLSRKLGGKAVAMGKLRELTMQAFGMDADVSLEEFKGIIERLFDHGLLKLNEAEKQAFTKTPMYGLLRYPVQFDLQLEDVDSALEHTLMKEDFYKRMVERLKGLEV